MIYNKRRISFPLCLLFLVVGLFVSACGESAKDKGPLESCQDASECTPGLLCGNRDGSEMKCYAPYAGRCSVSVGECLKGRCVPLKKGGDAGICQVSDCTDEADCKNKTGVTDSVCYHPIDQHQKSFCVKECKKNRDCGDHMVCDHTGPKSVCMPKSDLFASKKVVESRYHCIPMVNGITNITFQIPKGSAGFFVNLYSVPMIDFLPVHLKADGETYDLTHPKADRFAYMVKGNYINRGAHSLFFSMTKDLKRTFMDNISGDKREVTYGVRPMRFPYREGANEICYATFNKEKIGKTLDINFYFVAPKFKENGHARVLTADDAKESTVFQSLVERVRTIYAEKGIKLGKIRYIDSPEEVIKKYKVINILAPLGGEPDPSPFYKLVSTSVDHEGSLEERLAVNVFLVEDIVSDLGVIGISTGLPGMLALNGTVKSGVVFGLKGLAGTFTDPITRDQGPGSKFIGNTMAHEIGHYLGLEHTSELYNPSRPKDERGDHLSDTEQCSNEQQKKNIKRCKDFNNLMFPAAGLDHSELTKEQADVMKANPLLK